MKNFMTHDFIVTEILFACYVGANRGKNRHSDRASHGLAFHLEGNKEYHFSDGRVITAVENSIIYLPKGSSYYVKTVNAGACYAVNFQIVEEQRFLPFAQNIKNTSDFLHMFKSAQTNWDSKASGYNMRCKADLYNIICHMQQEYRISYIPKSKYKIIEPAVEYIKNNFTTELLNVSNLSEMCDITPEYFRKIFREFFGDSPVAYINKMKIDRAAELINSEMYSISDVAELSGFSDPCHFSREFKKAKGKSPSKYIK